MSDNNINVSFFAGNRRKSIKLDGKTYQLFIRSSGGANVLVNGEAYDVIYLPLTCCLTWMNNKFLKAFYVYFFYNLFNI